MRANDTPVLSPPISPAASRVALVALLLAVCVSGLLCVFPELDFDIWWHLRTGQLVVEQGRVPTTDPFSFTAAARPWVTHEWLSEVLFYWIHEWGGIEALIWLKALAAAAALSLSAAAGMAGHARARLPAATLGVLLAGPLLAPRAFVRPHMLTALLLGATLLCLRRATLTGRRRWRIALAPLFLFWANVHSGFVLGLALVALYWIGETLETRSDQDESLPQPDGRAFTTRQRGWQAARSHLLRLGALTALTLVNPHTYRALLYPFQLIARQEVRDTIVELRSIFHPAYAGAFFLKALVATGVLLSAVFWIERRRLRWSLALPGIVFAFLAVRTLRGVSEFAVLVPAIVAAHGCALARRPRLWLATAAATGALALVGGAAALQRGVPMGADPPRRVALGADPTNRPDVATRFLRDAAPPGRVFNILAFGGWFIQELWPGRQVYIDGRLDVYPPGFIASYRMLMRTAAGWDEAVARYDLAFAVVDYVDNPLADRGLRARLREDPNWVVVCFSDNAIVYARRMPANDALIERFGCPFDPSLRTPESLGEWLRSATASEVTQAVNAIERMLPFTSDARAPRLVLGSLLQRTGELALMSGRRADAIAHLERAVTVNPELHLAHMRLGILRAQDGDLTAAHQHFAAAQKISPNDPSLVQNLKMLEALEARRPATSALPSHP